MSQSKINFKIDKKLKKELDKICEGLGSFFPKKVTFSSFKSIQSRGI